MRRGRATVFPQAFDRRQAPQRARRVDIARCVTHIATALVCEPARSGAVPVRDRIATRVELPESTRALRLQPIQRRVQGGDLVTQPTTLDRLTREQLQTLGDEVEPTPSHTTIIRTHVRNIKRNIA